MKNFAFIASSLFLLASCSQMQFNRETNRSAAIDGVLTAESKALAQAYAEALNEGNATSLALTGEQPLSQSKIKRFRTALYQRVAKPQASLAENQSSEDLIVEMAEQVSFALSDAGISGTPAVLAPVSQVSLNYTELSKPSLERIMTTTLFAAENFSEEDGQSLLKQIIQRSNPSVVPKLLRAMMSSSDQLVMTQEELIYNFANHMNGQPQVVVAGAIAESLDLMDEYSIAATKPVKGFRDSVDPEVQTALAEVFDGLDAAAAAAAVGRKLIDANRNLDELNASLAKAKALAKAAVKESKKDQKKTEVAAAPTASSSSQSDEVVVENDAPASDTTAPTLHAIPFAPADGASSVALNADLVIRFSEGVVAGDGNIVLKSGGSVVQTVAASAATISDDTATIDIDPLSVGTSYHVLIDDDAFEDAAGNSFAGISSATAWNFDAAAATLVNFDFSNAGDYTCEGGACNSATNIDISGGVASLKVIDLTVDSAAEIVHGSSNGVSASSDALALTGSGNVMALNANTPHWSDLILYYPMDGNANDASGNNRHGSLNGDPTFTTDARIGSQSITLDGTGDYIDTGWEMNLATSDTLTMMFWMKSTTGNKYLAGVGNSGLSQYFFVLFAGSGFIRPYFRSNDGTSYDIPSFWTDGEPNTGDWEHFAMVYDGPSNAAHVYLNGRKENTKALDVSGGWANMNTGFNLFVGTINNWGSPSSSYYNGQLDEFAMFDAVLTTKEIETIYQHQRAAVAGYYTSKVFDVGQDLNISSLAVNSPIPYGKPITASETTSSYPGIENAAGNSLLGTGLVALYHMDETSGTTANDSSGNGHHASKIGTGSNSSPGHVGKIGYALDLQDYYFEVADHDDFETPSFSVGAWIHPDTDQIGSSMNWRSVASEGSHNSSCTGWNLRYSYNAAYPNGLPSLCLKFSNADIGSSGVYEVVSPSTEFAPGRWNHIFATFDGTTARIYLNGSEIVAKTGDDDGDLFSSSAIASNTHPFYIGGYGFDGLLDELGVWNRALSAAEILELYKRGGSNWSVQYRACTASDCSDAGNGGWSQTTGLSSGLSEWHNASALATGDPDYSAGNTNATSAYWYLTSLGAGNVSQLSGQYWQMRLNAFSHGAAHMPSASSISLNSRAGDVVSGAIDGPYPASKPELVTGTAVAFSSLTSMSITSSGNVKFAVSNDGGSSFMYWDGSAWSAAASGVGASAGDTTSNISSMPGGNIVVKVIFETDASGSTGGSVSDISLSGI